MVAAAGAVLLIPAALVAMPLSSRRFDVFVLSVLAGSFTARGAIFVTIVFAGGASCHTASSCSSPASSSLSA